MIIALNYDYCCQPIIYQSLKIQLIYFYFYIIVKKNITDDGHYTVNDGVKDKTKLANILKWQDTNKLSYWTDKGSCNQVKGQDATIFPPFITKESVLTIFNTDICR